MVDFANLLITKRIANIEEYLKYLSHEELPPYISNNHGTDSILAAAHAWRRLAKNLRDLALRNKKMVSELEKTSTTTTTSRIAFLLTQYAAWLDSTAKAAQSTADCLVRAAATYTIARSHMAEPVQFQAIRGEITTLETANTYAEHSEDIIQLQHEYATKKADNIKSIKKYYYAAATTTSELPQFPQCQLISRAKQEKGHCSVR